MRSAGSPSWLAATSRRGAAAHAGTSRQTTARQSGLLTTPNPLNIVGILIRNTEPHEDLLLHVIDVDGRRRRGGDVAVVGQQGVTNARVHPVPHEVVERRAH